jgi:hypothetical protein
MINRIVRRCNTVYCSVQLSAFELIGSFLLPLVFLGKNTKDKAAILLIFSLKLRCELYALMQNVNLKKS